METVRGFGYLGDRLNASGGCETAVTSKVRIRWMKCRECGKLLRGKRFSLRMKGMVYRSCIRSAMLHGSETWCLRESEMAILRRTERAMVRSLCGENLLDRKKMEELMQMLGMKETLDRMAKANGVRWYGHVIRRDDDNILKKAVTLEVNEKRKRILLLLLLGNAYSIQYFFISRTGIKFASCIVDRRYTRHHTNLVPYFLVWLRTGVLQNLVCVLADLL